VIDELSARAALGMGAVTALLSGLVALTVSRRWTHRDSGTSDSLNEAALRSSLTP
jgi:hypothetical protein